MESSRWFEICDFHVKITQCRFTTKKVNYTQRNSYEAKSIEFGNLLLINGCHTMRWTRWLFESGEFINIKMQTLKYVFHSFLLYKTSIHIGRIGLMKSGNWCANAILYVLLINCKNIKFWAIKNVFSESNTMFSTTHNEVTSMSLIHIHCDLFGKNCFSLISIVNIGLGDEEEVHQIYLNICIEYADFSPSTVDYRIQLKFCAVLPNTIFCLCYCCSCCCDLCCCCCCHFLSIVCCFVIVVVIRFAASLACAHFGCCCFHSSTILHWSWLIIILQQLLFICLLSPMQFAYGDFMPR